MRFDDLCSSSFDLDALAAEALDIRISKAVESIPAIVYTRRDRFAFARLPFVIPVPR